MTREQAKEKVITVLGLSKNGTKISCNVLPSHLSGDPIIIYQVVNSNYQVFDYCEEDLAEAVDKFLDLTEDEWAEKDNTRNRITIDAEDLRQQNYEIIEARYNQWCEDNYDALADIERQILQANKDGLRTMGADIPREDIENYKRFFTERHFDVSCHHYKEGKYLLKLNWTGKPKVRRKVKCNKDTAGLMVD